MVFWGLAGGFGVLCAATCSSGDVLALLAGFWTVTRQKKGYFNSLNMLHLMSLTQALAQEATIWMQHWSHICQFDTDMLSGCCSFPGCWARPAPKMLPAEERTQKRPGTTTTEQLHAWHSGQALQLMAGRLKGWAKTFSCPCILPTSWFSLCSLGKKPAMDRWWLWTGRLCVWPQGCDHGSCWETPPPVQNLALIWHEPKSR